MSNIKVSDSIRSANILHDDVANSLHCTAVELFSTSDNGGKPITEFAILVVVGRCQQPAGWFDQLDPHWNITQCVLAEVHITYS